MGGLSRGFPGAFVISPSRVAECWIGWHAERVDQGPDGHAVRFSTGRVLDLGSYYELSPVLTGDRRDLMVAVGSELFENANRWSREERFELARMMTLEWMEWANGPGGRS